MNPKQLPYPVVRAGMVLGSACFFFLMTAGIGGVLAAALTKGDLESSHAAWMFAIGLLSVAFFAGQGGSISLLDAFSQGWIALPSRPAPPPTAAVRNPWSVAARWGLAVGLPCAVLGYFAVERIWPAGVSKEAFGWLFGLTSAVLGATIIAVLSGRTFREQARLPEARRAFAGSHHAYLWHRHFLPQALCNGFLNAWVAFALAPARLSDADPRVASEIVLNDATGTPLVLGIAIALGVHSYAKFDLRWGVTAGSPGKAPHPALRAGALIGSALLITLLVRGLFALFGWTGIGLWSFFVWRGLLAGLYCGAVAWCIARWNQLTPRDAALSPAADRAAA